MPKEVEIQSFVDKNKWQELLEYFNENAKFLGEENQITYYYDGDKDLRIQLTDNNSKLWLKSGDVHDTVRDEIEIECQKDDFNNLDKLLNTLGYSKEIEWHRIRRKYKRGALNVALDYTKGYGYIIEMDILTEGKEKEYLEEIKKKFKELKIDISSKEEFDKKYKYYKENWQELIDEK